MNEDDTRRDRPPLPGFWRRLYLLVALVLALQILLYWLLTRSFA